MAVVIDKQEAAIVYTEIAMNLEPPPNALKIRKALSYIDIGNIFIAGDRDRRQRI